MKKMRKMRGNPGVTENAVIVIAEKEECLAEILRDLENLCRAQNPAEKDALAQNLGNL